MTFMLRRAAALALSLCALCAPFAHAAKPAWGPDAPGGADHPLVKRFTGSWLVGYKASDWDQTVMPVGMKVDADRHWQQTVAVEGRITRLIYLAPQGKSRLEVYRNYEQALMAAGLKRKFACEKDCNDLFFAMEPTTQNDKGMHWASGAIAAAGGGTFPIDSPLSYGEGRMLYGTLERGGKELHVLLYNGQAANETTDIAATYLEIVEPKAMQTGQVSVDAKAMQSGLAAEGKIALYGIYFDTGRAEVKPESKAQLDEMAKLLQAQPALKVFIVGHTDNQGAFDANLTLSQQRATAVSNALVTRYKVDARRLQPRGVASLSPVASNASEDGRSRNRRVELVVQ